MDTQYDADRAARAVEFIETLLVHTKGAYARQPFELAEFQRTEIIEPLFGSLMLDPDTGEWVRQYQLAWLEMARKNGKSELMAALALLLTGGDDEEGAEVYGVAKDTDQASLVFNVAKRMVELSPILSKHFTIYATNRRIVYAKTASFYRVVAADALGNLGQDPHGILFDEVIAQPDGQLWDAMKTGFGSRRQPLMVAATTAGDDIAEFARSEHDFSAKVLADPSLDPRRFVFMRNLPTDADWRDESRWGEANPALGIFLRPQVLRDEARTAANNPREERRFRMFRLNQWQSGGVSPWAAADEWNAKGNAGIVDAAKLKGKRCWGGLVAASAQDLSALAWTFVNPEGIGAWTLWRYFLPEEQLAELNRRTNGMAEVWAKPGGPLTITPGDQIDIPGIVAQVKADAALFDVREIAYWAGGAIGIVQPLMEAKVAEFVAIYANTPGSALIDWERMVRAGEYNHGGNPITAWSIGHMAVRETVGAVQRIDPRASTENIYGPLAAELALRRWLLGASKPRARTGFL